VKRKRDTWAAGPAPYHRMNATVEAAKHLSNVARRYAQGKATLADMNEAVGIWEMWAKRAPDAKDEP
jgi:hypothetical protein